MTVTKAPYVIVIGGSKVSHNIINIQILIIDNNRNFGNVFAKLLQIKGFLLLLRPRSKQGYNT